MSIREYVLPLGGNEIKRHTVGSKGKLLDQALRKGLPVPAGVIVLEEAWQSLEQRDFISHLDLQPNASVSELIELLQTRGLFAPWVVRSCFNVEDGAETSFAGMFTSVLGVDETVLEQAVLDVLASASQTSVNQYRHATKDDAPLRRDILIMPQINAQHAGVAFSDSEYEDDWLNVTDGLADGLLSGKTAGETRKVARLRWLERSQTHLKTEDAQADDTDSDDAWLTRTQALLRQVRQSFGDKPWDIEWADDGETCYLLQLRPISRSVRRNDVFTIANHKEILPALPSRLMASVIAACAPSLFNYYRQFDPSLPKTRPFIELFRWRPYINLSLMTDMMRHFGLPTRLVTDSIGGDVDEDVGLQPLRLVRKIFVLARLGLAQLLSVPSSRKARHDILAKTVPYADAGPKDAVSFREILDNLAWVYSRLVREMFSLTAATSAPVSLLRRSGALPLHSASQRTIGTAMLTDLNPIKAYVATRPDLHASLEEGTLPDNPKLNEMWQTYLDKHGHRGVFESDIARPRLREDPAFMLRTLLQPPLGHQTEAVTLSGRWKSRLTSWRALVTLPLWWQARRSIAARELLRYDAMKSFAHLRTALLTLADAAIARGQLPDREAIWQLSQDELIALDVGKVYDHAFMTARNQEIDALADIHLPDLLNRFDDLEKYSPAATRNRTHFHGISLTTGSVRGRAWCLREPASRLPQGFVSETTILVAPSIDSGWLPAFNLVAGVVVETGGDLSHGSIILRELGLPAVTNASGVMRGVRTGDVLVLEAGEGNVARVDAAAIQDESVEAFK
ncbi:MAG: PEP/pyruvate-binding domain-containing protein [Deinococcota bacterium]